MDDKLLKVKNLCVYYKTDDGVIRALNDLNLELREGSTLGLVGETGAGKTTLVKCIMRIIRTPPGHIESGEIIYAGNDILKMNEAEVRAYRGNDISMIFQDPMSSLNPVMRIEEQIAEVIKEHEKVKANEAMQKAHEMLELVGISKERGREYPNQFSGGMKQRVIIATALACNPRLLIADEPTTALDVTIQAQVLEMMSELKQRINTSMLLITHDLGIVAQNCDDVAIIYAGEIVESGTLRDIFKNTLHPYTKGLFGTIPRLDANVERLTPIPGLMPDPANLPAGCNFAPRCKYAKEICKTCKPDNVLVDGEHYVKCFLYQNVPACAKEK